MKPKLRRCWGKELAPIYPQEGDVWYPFKEQKDVTPFMFVEDDGDLPVTAMFLTKEKVEEVNKLRKEDKNG